ncbi:MAG: SDR family oxidoreductase, partial [Xanthomonadales bacterium]|nr:SDR family oxidoreductase [Xanthomonadales bacterium]
MSDNIRGKVIVITGASSGMGEATARGLAAKGAKVVLGARRADRLAQIVSDITAQGWEAIAVPTDVTQRADLQKLVDTAISTYGRIDVLFNNAGHGLPPFRIADTDIDTFDRMLQVHVRAVVLGMKYVAPVMQAQRSGSIITTASVAGYRAGGSSHAYCTAKAAVLHLTRSVAA